MPLCCLLIVAPCLLRGAWSYFRSRDARKRSADWPAKSVSCRFCGQSLRTFRRAYPGEGSRQRYHTIQAFFGKSRYASLPYLTYLTYHTGGFSQVWFGPSPLETLETSRRATSHEQPFACHRSPIACRGHFSQNGDFAYNGYFVQNGLSPKMTSVRNTPRL